MATTDMQRLVVALEARTKAFENALNKANGVANRRARQVESRFATMNKRVSASFAGIGRGMVGALAGAASLRGAQQLIDSATRIENALKVAGLSGQELADVYDRLFDSAQKNAAPLESLVTLYGRAAIVQKELGVTTEELLGFTDNVALALRVAGTDAQSASGALLQLSQALGSGVVRAEEFNSMLEGALPVVQAAAAGLEEAGGSVAKLRALVVDGKVSSQAFFRAFEAGSVILEEKVAGAELTVSQAFVRLQNVLIDTAGELNEGTDASRELAAALEDLGVWIQNLDFGSAITGALEFANQVGAAVDTLIRLKQSIYDVARAISEWTGGAAIGDALVDRGIMVRGDTAGKEQARIQDRFNDAFRRDPKGDRLQPESTQLPRIEVSPVSLSDYAVTGGSGSGGGRGGRGGNDYQREVAQIRERTAALQAETAAMAGLNPLIDDYGFAVEQAAAKQELLEAAKKAGLEITPALAASIDQLATGYATASAEAEKLAHSQDEARAAAEDMRDLGKDVLGGFINDLRNGTSAADALQNALGKVADKLLDMALNSLFSGGGGFLSAIFPFAEGGVAAHGKPLKRFARGGVSRSAAIFGEAGPEAAVPLPDGRSIPVTLNVPKTPKGGGASATNISMPVTINAPGADAAALARVEQSVRELGRNVPKMAVSAVKTTQNRKTRP